jgi:hypothetical protein
MGAVNSLSCVTLSLCFSLTNYPIYPPSSSVNNDFVEVDELILEIADYKKTTMPIWLPKNFLGSARPVGNEIEVNGEVMTPKHP